MTFILPFSPTLIKDSKHVHFWNPQTSSPSSEEVSDGTSFTLRTPPRRVRLNVLLSLITNEPVTVVLSVSLPFNYCRTDIIKNTSSLTTSIFDLQSDSSSGLSPTLISFGLTQNPDRTSDNPPQNLTFSVHFRPVSTLV